MSTYVPMTCSNCHAVVDVKFLGRSCPDCGKILTGMPKGITPGHETNCSPQLSKGPVFVAEESSRPLSTATATDPILPTIKTVTYDQVLVTCPCLREVNVSLVELKIINGMGVRYSGYRDYPCGIKVDAKNWLVLVFCQCGKTGSANLDELTQQALALAPAFDFSAQS